MYRRAYKFIPVLLAAAPIFSTNITAFAAKLKVGSIAGLPEKLVVLDDNGNSVSENGEYFFEVDNMRSGELYTKKIQIMNLREDASYHIYMTAQGISSRGDIDLENECECDIYMDDALVYYGKVNGAGTPGMTDEPLNLGLYHPGDSHVMTVSVFWKDPGHGGLVDNGARVVDVNGTSVVRERSGKDHIEGETIFKWIFTAVVKDTQGSSEEDDPSEVTKPETSTASHVSAPDSPGGTSNASCATVSPSRADVSGGGTIIDFVKTGDTIAMIAIGIVAAAMAFMVILVAGKRRKLNKQKNKS